MTIDKIIQKIYEERYQDPKSEAITAYMRDVIVREIVQRTLELVTEDQPALEAEFRECAPCTAKPGSHPVTNEEPPQLCAACLHNRTTIDRLAAHCAAAPNNNLYDLCARAFDTTRDDAKQRVFAAAYGGKPSDDSPKDIPPHAFEPYDVPSSPFLADYCRHCAKPRHEHDLAPIPTDDLYERR